MVKNLKYVLDNNQTQVKCDMFLTKFTNKVQIFIFIENKPLQTSPKEPF